MNSIKSRFKTIFWQRRGEKLEYPAGRNDESSAPRPPTPPDELDQSSTAHRQSCGVPAASSMVIAPSSVAAASLSTLPPEMGLSILRQAGPSTLLSMAAISQDQRRLAQAYKESMPTRVLLQGLASEPSAASVRFFYDEILSRLERERPVGDAFEPWQDLSAALKKQAGEGVRSFFESFPGERRLPADRSTLQLTLRAPSIAIGRKLSLLVDQAAEGGLRATPSDAARAAEIGESATLVFLLSQLQANLEAAIRSGHADHILTARHALYGGLERSITAAICCGQYDIAQMLLQQPMYRPSARTPLSESALERRIFLAASVLADEEAVATLLEPDFGGVVTESILAKNEAQLERARRILVDPSEASHAEHATVLALESDGSLTAWADALAQIRTRSALPKGLHDAIGQFGQAARSGDALALARAAAEVATLVAPRRAHHFTARQAQDLATTLLGTSVFELSGDELANRLYAMTIPDALLLPDDLFLSQQFVLRLMDDMGVLRNIPLPLF